MNFYTHLCENTQKTPIFFTVVKILVKEVCMKQFTIIITKEYIFDYVKKVLGLIPSTANK